MSLLDALGAWWLRRRLRSESRQVRERALEQVRAQPDRVAEPGVAAAAVEAFARAVPDPASRVTAALADASSIVMEQARSLLGAADAGARAQAAALLGCSKDSADRERLRALLEDDAPVVRDAAVRGLARAGDRAAIPWLRACLRDPAAEVRLATLYALGVLADRGLFDAPLAAPFRGMSALPPMTVAASDDDPLVRRQAMAVMRELADPRAVPLLIAALADPDRQTRRLAAEALDANGWRPADPDLVARMAVALDHAAEGIPSLGEAAVLQLLTLLGEPPSALRAATTLCWLLKSSARELSDRTIDHIARLPDVTRNLRDDDEPFDPAMVHPLDLSELRGLAAAELRRRRRS